MPPTPKPQAQPSKATHVRVVAAVTFPGRGALTLMTSEPTKNVSLSGDSGGFEMSTKAMGVVVVDPKHRTTTLIPWSNVVSAQIE